ncbi:hypothetical protein L6164_024458 [Bauhinia variegata]|uniref:Uncharacterized protein n=1 Tax=Bauhinia variegata TaxID=167791 RepID=A0ACB9LXP2_BAUVA|nr:hypothetical protein L6164_024458 [Bauhinia variegata]
MSRRDSPQTQLRLQTPPSPAPRGCCPGFSNVKNTASTSAVSVSQQNITEQHSIRLETKVADLEKEVERQKELRMMYRKRMERTQDYLRYCLQIAQENGILDLIVHYKGELAGQTASPSPLSVHTPNHYNRSPQTQITTPSSTPHHPSHPVLAAVTHQAEINGWYIDPTEILLEAKIGEGSTAEIYRGTWRGLDVAVKCISAEFFGTNANGVAFFAQEIETLSRQRHRFVLQLIGACLEPPHHAWVVTEYMRTTLKEWLHGPGKRRKERIVELAPLKERVSKALEIAQAMRYLHEQKPKVIHRDLKPGNIFLDDAMHVRVADFGHARFLDDEEMALTGETGTYVYMAPEVIRCEPYNEKCDVYSFGVILNELLTGKYPYIETDYGPTKIAMEVVEGKLRPELPEDKDGELAELIELICVCWDGNPAVRPSFATITNTLKT